jgi:hypothetical protein
MYDLVTQISRQYNRPIIEITESGCGYLDGPDEEETDVARLQHLKDHKKTLQSALVKERIGAAFSTLTRPERKLGSDLQQERRHERSSI